MNGVMRAGRDEWGAEGRGDEWNCVNVAELVGGLSPCLPLHSRAIRH